MDGENILERQLGLNGENATAELRIMAERYHAEHISDFLLLDARFPLWSGSSKPEQHHYGRGGLAIHTLEVVRLCLLNHDYFCAIGKPAIEDSRGEVKIFLAALYHDAGKMWDYQPKNAEYTEWEGGEHKRRIHHISRSAIEWSLAVRAAAKYKEVEIEPEDEDDVLHAILAHHGQRAWGSPVTPATRLAWLLHLCDGLSARIDDCQKMDILKYQG